MGVLALQGDQHGLFINQLGLSDAVRPRLDQHAALAGCGVKGVQPVVNGHHIVKLGARVDDAAESGVDSADIKVILGHFLRCAGGRVAHIQGAAAAADIALTVGPPGQLFKHTVARVLIFLERLLARLFIHRGKVGTVEVNLCRDQPAAVRKNAGRAAFADGQGAQRGGLAPARVNDKILGQDAAVLFGFFNGLAARSGKDNLTVGRPGKLESIALRRQTADSAGLVFQHPDVAGVAVFFKISLPQHKGSQLSIRRNQGTAGKAVIQKGLRGEVFHKAPPCPVGRYFNVFLNISASSNYYAIPHKSQGHGPKSLSKTDRQPAIFEDARPSSR